MTFKRRPVLTAYLQKLGFKSLTFPAKFSGGKCGLCAVTIRKDGPVVFFRDKGLCHEACTTRVISLEEHLHNCARPHADPMVAAAYERSRPEAEAQLASLLGTEKK